MHRYFTMTSTQALNDARGAVRVYQSVGAAGSYICEEMSCGNQKVVRVTCQCIGISLRISGSADCQLVVCGGRRQNISHAPSHPRALAAASRFTHSFVFYINFILCNIFPPKHSFHCVCVHIYHRQILEIYLFLINILEKFIFPI